jgi:NAD(P)H dehydrogenase (quinone)
MRIAVTAASGQLGGAIVNRLLEMQESEDIVAIARTPEKARHFGVEVRKGDYNSHDNFVKALSDIDAVLIVSGMDAPDKRIQQHRNIINRAREAGVKKVVYTSVIGSDSGTTFSPIVASNRQTERDVRDSGLEWVIGRNGIYIEPDVEYIDHYRKAGKITNCAGDGKCSYTTRSELSFAYSRMLLEEKHNGKTYYLSGEAITQEQLVKYLNRAFGTNLVYDPIGVEEYKKERTAELGEFLGSVIAGIYEGIRSGAFEVDSDFKEAAGRDHIQWSAYFDQIPS